MWGDMLGGGTLGTRQTGLQRQESRAKMRKEKGYVGWEAKQQREGWESVMGQAWGQRNGGVDGLEGGERRKSWGDEATNWRVSLWDKIGRPHQTPTLSSWTGCQVEFARDLSARVAMIEASQRQVGSVQGEQVSGA